MTERPICPTCGAGLAGLALYCHICEEYVADMARSSASTSRPPAVRDDRSEEEIRLAIREALELMGFVVLDFEQGWRRDGSTRVRKGLADLFVMGYGVATWAEIKRIGQRPRPEQEEFADDCRRAGFPCALWFHENDAIAWAKAARG